MNTTTKILTFLLGAALLLTVACRNASDDTTPRIFDVLLNGTAAPNGGDHELGTVLPFQMSMEDNKGLAEFQVQINGMLNLSEQIEGTSHSASYSFTVDADDYMVGDSIQLLFIAEDEYGNIDFRPYSMLVIE